MVWTDHSANVWGRPVQGGVVARATRRVLGSDCQVLRDKIRNGESAYRDQNEYCDENESWGGISV